jgi:diaminohydroxyphosphoribosylaminopyrimidine deaminase/5-amino-6-(5-phosphoribosylamino)uracil reductase
VTPSQDDVYWLRHAIQLSKKCPPSTTAYNVGAVIVGADGSEIAFGYSRETDPHVHAEESALSKVSPDDPRLAGATIYSSLEPCSERRSRHVPCAKLILEAKIPRVVIAWREPAHFVADAQGAELLHDAGVTVVELPELEAAAKAQNRHLPPEMTGN